jgi:hypothetical protein
MCIYNPELALIYLLLLAASLVSLKLFKKKYNLPAEQSV